MNAVVQVLALLTALVHIVVWVWESFLFERPGIHKGIFSVPSQDVPPVMLWAFCVGFYNLFLAGAPIAGVILPGPTGRRPARAEPSPGRGHERRPRPGRAGARRADRGVVLERRCSGEAVL
jgi:hypothetical protein